MATIVVAVVVWPFGPLIATTNDPRPTVRFDEAAVARAVRDARPTQMFGGDGDWSSVVALAAGREIVLTTDAAPASRRRLLAADQAGIIVVDLSDPLLPDPVKRAVRDLLLQSPDTLVRVTHGATVARGRVRFAPEGIFLEGRRVADLDAMLQRVMRAEIVEVREGLERTSAGLMVVSMILVPAGAILHATSGGWRRPEPDINRGTILGGGMLLTGLVIGATALKRGSTAGRSPLVYRRR
ncbi:MAG: hypothetical protein IT183_07670 [Acidobacteria bacterium]|nr:hypothetical protein [Acidobacteriota bacterium]